MTDSEREAKDRIIDGLSTLVATGRITMDIRNHYLDMLNDLFGEEPKKKSRNQKVSLTQQQ